mmetsp:Transcript_7535/g.22009  ORF Transcript_7535/g.22009 Transcript_7535/m.22009 type:complete len:118 (-) Transcript_7535:46-399(-)
MDEGMKESNSFLFSFSFSLSLSGWVRYSIVARTFDLRKAPHSTFHPALSNVSKQNRTMMKETNKHQTSTRNKKKKKKKKKEGEEQKPLSSDTNNNKKEEDEPSLKHTAKIPSPEAVL